MQSNYPNHDPTAHHKGFVLHYPRHHKYRVSQHSDFDTNGDYKNCGALSAPDSTTVTVHPEPPPYTAPDSTPLTVNNEAEWIDINTEEHGTYLEPNAEKVYREKV